MQLVKVIEEWLDLEFILEGLLDLLMDLMCGWEVWGGW